MQLPSVEAPHAVGEEVAPGEVMRHEQSNVSIRRIGWFMVWFVVILVVVHALVWGIYVGILEAWKQDAGQPNTALATDANRPVPPTPRLQPSPDHDTVPRVDVERMWVEEKKLFADRGWVRDNKVVIPPDVADRVLAATRSSAPATRPSAAAN